MDVNGTRFHLLLGPRDWGAEDGLPGLAWSDRDRSLQLAGLPFVFPARRAEEAPGEHARRGAGRDRFGNWYWIDERRGGILTRAPGDHRPRSFWPPHPAPAAPAEGEFAPVSDPAPPEPRSLGGLAVTAEHYLVVGTLDPAGLLLFDLAAGGPPVSMTWPESVAFAPDDLVATPDGGLWILDTNEGRLWSLDRGFRVRAPSLPPPPEDPEPEFVPTDPGPGTGPPSVTGPSAEPLRPVTLAASLDVSALSGLSAVTSLPDGTALLLGEEASGEGPELHRYALAGLVESRAVAPLMEDHEAAAEQLPRAHDLAFVADGPPERDRFQGTLYLVAPNGNQAFAFDVSGGADALTLAFDEAFYPMRRFGGRGLVAAGGEAYYDSEDRWVLLLEQPRPRFETEATLVVPPPHPDEDTGAFDGRMPGCVWHRLFLDGCLPPGSSVTVETRAADSLAALPEEDWRQEPELHMRDGSELPWTPPAAPEGAANTGTFELLFQAARGRYLQVRLRLRGNGRTTPRLYALRAYYPRFSYLREYLPAAYREDPVSASFLDRYLANVEGMFTDLEGRIAASQFLLDTRTVPAEFLDWLGGWLGASLDAAWDEEKRRFFLANALRMYEGRGTREGLVRAFRLALEECPDPDLFEPVDAVPRFGVRVVERFLSRSVPGVAYTETGDAALPGVASDAPWSPARGARPLHEQWRAWLRGRYADVEALNTAWGTSYEALDDRSLRLPATAPDGAAGNDWRRFLRDALTFTYEAPDPSDVVLWRDFLERRYRQPVDLNRAWRRSGSAATGSFDALELPAALPDSGAELADWITFVSVVLPMRRGAHRFTVLVPVQLEDPPEVQRSRRDLVSRVAVLEKPAHTVVRTRLYWAAFQVGEARLGHDSLLGLGSRFSTLVLGRGELGDGSLGWVEPWNVDGRRVVGRDPVAVQTTRVTRQSTRCS